MASLSEYFFGPFSQICHICTYIQRFVCELGQNRFFLSKQGTYGFLDWHCTMSWKSFLMQSRCVVCYCSCSSSAISAKYFLKGACSVTNIAVRWWENYCIKLSWKTNGRRIYLWTAIWVLYIMRDSDSNHCNFGNKIGHFQNYSDNMKSQSWVFTAAKKLNHLYIKKDVELIELDENIAKFTFFFNSWQIKLYYKLEVNW